MNSGDLTREQRDILIDRLLPSLGYLTKLARRMDQRGFTQDEIRAKVGTAQSAMQDLVMSLRYLRTLGTGKGPR